MRILHIQETELEKIYFRLLKTALKSMTDEVTEIRRLNVELV